MLARSSAGLAIAAVLAVGCAGGGMHSTATRSDATSTRRAFDDCLRFGLAVRIVSVPAPGERLPAVVLGRGGAIGVVFANQSASVACGWLPYARNVARDGVRSLVF